MVVEMILISVPPSTPSSWTQSKHECKLHGGWGPLSEGPPPAPIPFVPVDTPQLYRQLLCQLHTHGEQPQQAR